MASDKKTPDTQNVDQPQSSKDTFERSNQIIDTALSAATNSNGTDTAANSNDSSVANNFRGLPMRDLIGGPLLAAAEAQQNLASIAWDFYEKIAFETKTEGTGQAQKTTKSTRVVEFTVNRPVEQGGELKLLPQKVEAPFIGLVPIPSLLIDRVDVDFQMEVTDTNVSKTSSSAEASSKVSGGWWVAKAEVSGKVSSARENTRTTNQTAKYQVHVTASQQPQTEGLSKLMDIMASCIEPVPVSTPAPVTPPSTE